ncbi:MAG: type II toxin-antitoxin system RelE/ParE family toxin [Oscillospiraceae bacterium]|nr:type II toxin-antitoxin system RelE/ParE family toxin [Oscillospiraceae bacterium]
MKYEVLYLPIAGRDILGICDTLPGHSGKARRLLGEIESKLKLLEFMPRMWPPLHAKPEFWRMDLEDHELIYKVDDARRKVIVYRVLAVDVGEQLSGGAGYAHAGKSLPALELIEAEGE